MDDIFDVLNGIEGEDYLKYKTKQSTEILKIILTI